MDFTLLSKIIHYHRKRSGLSRIALANLAGVGKTSIYDIEHGKETVQLATVQKICKALNISVSFESPLMQQFEQNNEES